jgi:hypothetical protein
LHLKNNAQPLQGIRPFLVKKSALRLRRRKAAADPQFHF